MIKSKAQAQRLAGKISISNTKMPGSSFATDPYQCKTGSKLAAVKGTVCNRCYARRIASFRPSVKKGYESNHEKLLSASKEDWIEGMVYQIEKAYAKTGEPYHRWFDAGDLDSLETLEAICEVARRTPEIHHWLPTKEAQIIIKHGLRDTENVPSNLTIRLSGAKVNSTAPTRVYNTSTVHSSGSPYQGIECPAYKQSNKCGECRICWDKEIKNVSYPLH